MAKPWTWNAPKARWNAGLTWNSVVAALSKMKTKAIVDFTPYTALELGPLAQTIHDMMTTNAATFTAPPVTMVALQALITIYNAKLAARASRNPADTLAFNLARHDLEGALAELGGYVNSVALGDPAIVLKSGIPSYGTAHPSPAGPPSAPQNVRLRHGDLSGSIVSRCTPGRANSMNVAQICTGDPNVEANWKPSLTFAGGKVTISGLTVGSTVWVRIATVGAGAVVGAWSDPAKIVVT